MEEDLKSNGIDRVVVAACSPRDHEATFMDVMKKADLNPYLLQMVNIREQVAWVTKDAAEATGKASRYVTAAMKRVALHEPLEKKELDICPDVLIVGSGPAGLKAALAVGESGRKVVLVEKSPVIGGKPVKFEELFPALDCGPCMLEPIMGEVLHGNGDIELLTMAEVSGVVGSFGNFTVSIRQAPRYVDLHACVGCGECIPPCPVTLPNEFNERMDERKAIAFPFAGALPNAPFIDAACQRLQGKDCHACVDACPVDKAIQFDVSERVLERHVGAVLLAVGSDLYDCSQFPRLGYGTTKDVYTSMEFERILASNGPTNGEIRTSGGAAPGAVAVVHCVGSLDERHNDYCSGVCCQYSFKFNHMIRMRVPDAKVYHLYREIVCPGKGEAGLYHHTRSDAKTTFVRYNTIDDLRVDDTASGKVFHFTDANGKSGMMPVDMVVLCPAIVPAHDAAKLAAMFEVSQDSSGFYQELHGRADAVQSQVKGVYIAGTCQSPMDIQETMTQAMAAAGNALSGLVVGRKLEVGPVTASIIAERCSGCRTCGEICPYKAISFDPTRNVSSVNEVLCHGCGTCVAGCPAGAITGHHFTSQQIIAELEGVLQS